jgi:hypothetical protein
MMAARKVLSDTLLLTNRTDPSAIATVNPVDKFL